LSVYNKLPQCRCINLKRNIELQEAKNTKTGRLSHLLESILASQGGYLADQLYTFKRTEAQSFQLHAVQNKSAANLRWLILSREYYFEATKDYPIANKRDLKQALRFDDNKAPFEGITLQHIERIDEQSHRVTFWVINPTVLKKVNFAPWVILPESYILAKALSDNVNLATIECINKTLFISKTGRGLFSGVQSSHTPTIEHFAFSTGSPISMGSENYYHAKSIDFIDLLSKGLKSLNLAKLQGFLVNLNEFNWQNYPWKQAALISTTVFTLYLAISSGWLAFKDQQLTQQLVAKKTRVNQALTLQETYKQQLQWQELLAVPVKDNVPYWNTWPIVLEAIAVGAKFTAIHYQNSNVIIHGTANDSIKATDVLAKLSKNPYVVSASFSEPVRKYRGNENFVINFGFAKVLYKPEVEQTTKQAVK